MVEKGVESDGESDSGGNLGKNRSKKGKIWVFRNPSSKVGAFGFLREIGGQFGYQMKEEEEARASIGLGFDFRG